MDKIKDQLQIGVSANAHDAEQAEVTAPMVKRESFEAGGDPHSARLAVGPGFRKASCGGLPPR
jgi:hypothetical protein